MKFELGRGPAPAALGLTVIGLLALSAAGAVATPAVPSSLGPRWLDSGAHARAKAHGAIYISDASGWIDIYSTTLPAQLLGRITSSVAFPEGLAVDRIGNLYLANAYSGGNSYGPALEVYPPGQSQPSASYLSGMFHPVDVAVARDGTIYVADTGGNNIVVYVPGSQYAARFLIPQHGSPVGVAVSPNGDLYASYTNWDTGLGGVVRFAHGRGKSHDLGITLSLAGGIAFDKTGNLLACDQNAPAIDVFPPGQNTPSQVISNIGTPYALAMSADGSTMYVIEPVQRQLNEVAYPSGTVLGQISGFTDNTLGVAVSPAERP